MIYLIVSIFGLFFVKGRYSISRYWFFLLLISSVCAFVVGRQHQTDVQTLIYVIYNVVLLYFLFYSYKDFSNLKGVESDGINFRKLHTLERIFGVLCFMAIIVNTYILYKVLNMLSSDIFTVQEFKNEGGAGEVYDSLVPHVLISFSNFVTPIGYLFIGLHFYYLITKDIKRSICFLFLSTVIILNGLMALSRSVTVQYILVYVCMLFFVFPLLSNHARSKIIRIGIVVGVIIGFVFFVISSSRFSEFYYKRSKNEAMIDETTNPLLFSTLDYFSLWQENAPLLMDKYEFGHIYWGMFNSCGLAVQIEGRLGSGLTQKKAAREREFQKIMGDESNSFHGPIARLVHDFGWSGTILFILIMGVLIRKIQPTNGTAHFKTFFFLPLLLPFASSFFAGNVYGNLAIDLAVIYQLFIYQQIKKSSTKKIKYTQTQMQIST